MYSIKFFKGGIAMRRRLTVWVLLLSILINCFSTTSLADTCKHVNKIGQNPTYIYECEDEDYHILTEIRIYYECADCGECFTEIEICYNQKSEHVFQNNNCYVCGYECKEEKHKHNWKLSYAPWYQYVECDENYHVLERTVLEYSCECGETKREEQLGDGKKESHILMEILVVFVSI